MFVGMSAFPRDSGFEWDTICTICTCVFLWFLRVQDFRHIFVRNLFCVCWMCLLDLFISPVIIIQVCRRHSGSIRGHYDSSAWNMPFIPALCVGVQTRKNLEKNGIWTADPTEEIPRAREKRLKWFGLLLIRSCWQLGFWSENTIGCVRGRIPEPPQRNPAASWTSHRCGTGCDDESTPAWPPCPGWRRGCPSWMCPTSGS